MTLPLSVFLITLNEEARLGRTLSAVQDLAGEIVVVDSGSADATVEIAKKHGARVFHREWAGYGPQKRFAEQQCCYDWLLNLDADEVVTPELAAEIRALFSGSQPPPGAYRLRIRTVYPGEDRPRFFARTYNEIRLYHKNVGCYRDHPVYDRVVVESGRIGQLRACVYHYEFISFSHLIGKLNRLTDLQAATARGRNKPLLYARLLFEMPITFLKFYLLRGHVFGGYKGFVVSLSSAFMRTMRLAKMLERMERRH